MVTWPHACKKKGFVRAYRTVEHLYATRTYSVVYPNSVVNRVLHALLVETTKCSSLVLAADAGHPAYSCIGCGLFFSHDLPDTFF